VTRVSGRSSEPIEGEIDVSGDPGVVVLVRQVEQILDQLQSGAAATSTAEAKASPTVNPGSGLNSRRPRRAAAGAEALVSRTADIVGAPTGCRPEAASSIPQECGVS